ncbi:MAG: diacylglycerol kinase [Nitrospirota bacterium]|jgi:diacylglycerol kinase (ATP)
MAAEQPPQRSELDQAPGEWPEQLERDSRYRPGTWFESANYAVEGVITAVRSERHLRIHLLIGVVVIIASLYLQVTLQDFLILAIAMMLVFFAELMNTAVEVVVDLVTLERDPLAKMAKDISAGAVLVTASLAVIMGYITFAPYLRSCFEMTIAEIQVADEHLSIAALLLTIVVVIFWKVKSGRGRPLRGGLPSGHTAVATCVWAAVTLITASPLLSILVAVLAVMVGLSRVTLGIHSRVEVLLGAAVGGFVTLVLFQLLG